MEKLLVKTGIYTFIISFLLILVGKDRVYETTDVNGLTSHVEIPFPDYFLMITRNSIIISMIVVILMFVYQRISKNKS